MSATSCRGPLCLTVLLFLTLVGSAHTQKDGAKKETHLALFKSELIKSHPTDEEVRKLQIALYNERLAIAGTNFELFRGGHETCRVVLSSARQLRSAGLDVIASSTERIRLLEQILELEVEVGSVVATREHLYKRPGLPDTFLHELRLLREFRLETQIELVKLKKAEKKPSAKEIK